MGLDRRTNNGLSWLEERVFDLRDWLYRFSGSCPNKGSTVSKWAISPGSRRVDSCIDSRFTGQRKNRSFNCSLLFATVRSKYYYVTLCLLLGKKKKKDFLRPLLTTHVNMHIHSQADCENVFRERKFDGKKASFHYIYNSFDLFTDNSCKVFWSE